MKDKKTQNLNHRITEELNHKIMTGSKMLGYNMTDFVELAVYSFVMSDKFRKMAEEHLSELQLLNDHRDDLLESDFDIVNEQNKVTLVTKISPNNQISKASY